MIARVGDLLLQQQVEKAFPNPKDVVSLPNGYIAFHHSLWAKIQTMVIKSGHVIKMVEHK